MGIFGAIISTRGPANDSSVGEDQLVNPMVYGWDIPSGK